MNARRSGTATVSRWRCLACAEHGEGPDADKAAEKHTKAAGHCTMTSTTPVNPPKPTRPAR